MIFFRRIKKYVAPQWYRIAMVVVAATMVGLLFAMSFMTVIPLLKVMMGEEGLHGWVDRQGCKWRYEMNFAVPDKTDIMNNPDLSYELEVISVGKNSLAQQAGLKVKDNIIGIGENDPNHPQKSLDMMKELADCNSSENFILYVLRNIGGNVRTEKISLAVPKRFMFEDAGFIKKWKWGFRWEIIERARKITALLPRNNNALAQKKAISFIIIALIGVSILRCLASYTQKYMGAKVVQTATAHLREDMFERAMNMPVSYFTVNGTSDAISRMIGDVNGIGKGIRVLLGKSLQEPMKAIFMLGCALYLDYKLTLIFLAAAPATIYVMATFGKRVRKFAKKGLQTTSSMLGKLQESVAALRVVKVYNQQDRESAAYKALSRKNLKQTMRSAKADAATSPIMDILGMLAGSAALLVGIDMVTSSNMEPSVFFMILLALGVSAESVRKTSDVWNSIQDSNASMDRVFQIMDYPDEYEKPNSKELVSIKDKIEFKDIVFTYPNSPEPVLRKVNLSVKVGRNIAVVGSNGSGKTTLINLLPRFFSPDSGQILIDGVDIADCTLKSLRSHIAMVTQNVVTFHDTIAANIAYGKSDATMDEIIAAAKRSYAHEFIEPLPMGYETVLGEHGVGLSGGQLQRIVIARAILKNPSIFIFDEAMSQVDADSESKIHDAIEAIMHDRTSFVIAHRFSTIISADVIVVMDKGQIVAQGSHDELMKTCGIYHNLYETQLMPAE